MLPYLMLFSRTSLTNFGLGFSASSVKQSALKMGMDEQIQIATHLSVQPFIKKHPLPQAFVDASNINYMIINLCTVLNIITVV